MSWPLQGLVASKKWGTPTRRLMALTLSSVANDDGTGIYASVKTMARDSEISESTARRTLQEFEQEGILVKVGQRECLNGYTNVYSLEVRAIENLSDLKPKKAERGVTVTGVSPRQGCHEDTRPLSPRHQTPVTVTNNPILEPIQEPLIGVSPETPASKGKGKTRKRTAYSAEFETFWALWPQTWRERSDKQLAFRRWLDDIQQWPIETIMEAARRHIKRTAKEAHRFCGRADVFLNGKLEAAIEAVTSAPKQSGERWDPARGDFVRA